MERAEAAGLQYLGEAAFSMMLVEVLPRKIETTLRNVASTLIEVEQYMDFVHNRTFRQTLLCRQEVVLDRSLSPSRVAPMSVASATRPESPAGDLCTYEEMRFRIGTSVATTSDPMTKAALLCLGECWPKYLAFRELDDAARQRLDGERKELEPHRAAECEATLARALLGCYANGHVELSIRPPRFESVVTEKPLASRLARYQARKRNLVTNQFHTDVLLQEHERQLLCNLDGQRDLISLTSYLASLFSNGTLRLTNEKGIVKDPKKISQVVQEGVRSAKCIFNLVA